MEVHLLHCGLTSSHLTFRALSPIRSVLDHLRDKYFNSLASEAPCTGSSVSNKSDGRRGCSGGGALTRLHLGAAFSCHGRGAEYVSSHSGSDTILQVRTGHILVRGGKKEKEKKASTGVIHRRHPRVSSTGKAGGASRPQGKHYRRPKLHCRLKAWEDSTSGAVFPSRSANATCVEEHTRIA